MEITNTIFAGLRSTADENVTFLLVPAPLNFFCCLVDRKSWSSSSSLSVCTRANFDSDITQPFTFTQSGAQKSECACAIGTFQRGVIFFDEEGGSFDHVCYTTEVAALECFDKMTVLVWW